VLDESDGTETLSTF